MSIWQITVRKAQRVDYGGKEDRRRRETKGDENGKVKWKGKKDGRSPKKKENDTDDTNTIRVAKKRIRKRLSKNAQKRKQKKGRRQRKRTRKRRGTRRRWRKRKGCQL